MVEFYSEWYKNLISHSNEKDLLVNKIKHLLEGKTHNNCLEIGLGTSTYFSERLSPSFEEYTIIERESFNKQLPDKVKLIQDDFEEFNFEEKFDVIIASHVVYYFKNLSGVINKMSELLNQNGRIYFVVNGIESDYGPIKHAFAGFINKPYVFTYDILKEHLKKFKTKEYTAQASLNFDSYEDLYEAMRLFFDMYPKEYEENKENIIDWLGKNIKGNKFFMDQKIIEAKKNH